MTRRRSSMISSSQPCRRRQHQEAATIGRQRARPQAEPYPFRSPRSPATGGTSGFSGSGLSSAISAGRDTPILELVAARGDATGATGTSPEA